MKKNATNLNEFKALIKRYKTITIDEIEEKYCDANELTGFGKHSTCTLCQAVPWNMDKKNFPPSCRRCVYPGNLGCIKHKTYIAIEEAEDTNSPEELLAAYRARAEYMEGLIKEGK
jgi:hypothetical protein